MIEITIKGREKIDRALVNLGRELQNPQKALNQIGILMVTSVDKNFEEQGRPIKWESLKPMTIAMRRDKDKSKIKILQDSGILRGSIAYKITEDGTGVAVGTNKKYGEVHQFGGTSRIPARTIVPKTAKVLRFVIDGKVVFAKRVKQKARTAIIPRRPFLLFQDEDISNIRDIFIEDLENEINS